MTRLLALALLAIAPAAVLAQVPPPPPASLPPIEGQRATADEGKGTLPPPDVYTIRQGDTLWDLSGRFLNNPWYWPKIWSYNPEIANPHWIYPGNVLKFYPLSEEAPARVDAAPAPMAAAEVEDDAGVAVRELEDFSKANLKDEATVEEQETVAVVGPHRIAYVPPKTRFARHDTFVTPRELAESGALTAAFEEKLMLTTEDRAYARFRDVAGVKPGETYVVFKTERPIYHPVTKELFGYQSTVLGSAQVVAVEERAATVVVKQSYEPIERGAMLGPWTDKFYRSVGRKPNRQALAGRIVASQMDVITMIGEHHVVFVDKGSQDGVEEGNVFTVIRSGDQYDRDPYAAPWDDRLPREDVGFLLVVDVKDRASAALVTRSLKELVVGDRVEMRAEGGSAGN
jgi:hypothetical protein